MTDKKDPNWVPPWEIVEGEGFLSGNAFEVPVNERELGEVVDVRLIRSVQVPDAYGDKFGVDVLDAKQLMTNTGMNAKQLIAASSINDNSINEDQTVFGSGVLKLADAIVANKEQTVLVSGVDLDEQFLRDVQEQIDKGEHVFMPHGHPGHKFKFGEVSWNPEVKGLESISGPSVLPSSLPYNTVPRAISAIKEKVEIPTLKLPLTEEMKAFLSENIGGIFLVDYSTDPLHGKEFLDQFVGLPCAADVVFSKDLPYDQYELLVRSFMVSDTMYHIPILNAAVADLVLTYRGNRYNQSPYATPFSEEFVQKFLARNSCLLDRWVTFCDSMLLFGIYSIKPLNKHYRPEEYFPAINDTFYIGVNAALLMMMPEFSAHYFAIENVERHFYYFKQQFETDCFDGKNLLKYFRSKNNYLASALEAIAQGHYKPSDVGFGIFDKGVFDPTYPIGEFDFEKKTD